MNPFKNCLAVCVPNKFGGYSIHRFDKTQRPNAWKNVRAREAAGILPRGVVILDGDAGYDERQMFSLMAMNTAQNRDLVRELDAARLITEIAQDQDQDHFCGVITDRNEEAADDQVINSLGIIEHLADVGDGVELEVDSRSLARLPFEVDESVEGRRISALLYDGSIHKSVHARAERFGLIVPFHLGLLPAIRSWRSQASQGVTE